MPQIKSDMAGTILEIKVKVGSVVQEGNEVAVLESMKMEVPLIAQSAGTVVSLKKQVGEFINEGEVLLELQ